MTINLKDLRIPYEGRIDLTYRCNNDCRHCWLRIPANDSAREQELTFEEIKDIVNQARAMGTRRWSISGGEPMLRPDFADIFDYITSKSVSYSINTNGTMITPKIAQLLKRKGTKMIAVYGATKETYDHVTRLPGGFERLMQGIRYMQEADAKFIVQLIPMRDNWHEWDKMKELAKSLSDTWRVGAPWLYYSSCQDAECNHEISRQRLDPKDVVALDLPDLSYEGASASEYVPIEGDDRLFAPCLSGRRDFHIDPYGGMTFCNFLKDPQMRYDLRKGTFQEAWDVFIPSLADKVHAGPEYYENCGSCDKRKDCRWCPVYGWLEHENYSAPVEHLCEVAEENRRYKQEWLASHRRFFKIGGFTVQVDSDLPMDENTFDKKFESFFVDGPGPDNLSIRHHFSLPDLEGKELGKELYRKAPWAISRQNGSYIYRGISPRPDDRSIHKVATFNLEHTRARIYNDREDLWTKGGIHSLTLFPSDQILIARVLADRQGCYLHSAGVILNGAGMLFVGHSEAGKSTTTKLLMAAARGEYGGDAPQVEILCDDRNIVRRLENGWQVYGTWSHGEIPIVSSSDAPLRAICFIEKASENTITPIEDKKEISRRLLACLIKPFVTADWWHKSLDLIEAMAREAPFYRMRFDKSGEIVKSLVQL